MQPQPNGFIRNISASITPDTREKLKVRNTGFINSDRMFMLFTEHEQVKRINIKYNEWLKSYDITLYRAAADGEFLMDPSDNFIAINGTRNLPLGEVETAVKKLMGIS